MTPDQHIEGSRDRGDLEWLSRRLSAHAQRASSRGEADAAAVLERLARSLAREASRPVPAVDAPQPKPYRAPAEDKHAQQRRASARSPWRSRAVLPPKGHGGFRG